MKRVITALMMIALCLQLTACSSATPNLEKLDQEKTYPDAPGSLEIVYKTIDDLINAAEVIAEINVMSSEVKLIDGFPQTHSQAKVINVLKGDLKADETIEVIEEGGLTEKGEAIAGVPVMKNKSTYILCLIRQDEAYFVVGGFQGKFIEKEGFVFQQATEETKIKEYSPVKIETFKERMTSKTDKAAS